MKRFLFLLVLLSIPSVLTAQNPKVRGTVVLTVTASDITAVAGDTECGIQKVQFLLDGAVLGAALTTAPYTYSWDTLKVTEGNHEIRALAYDKSGGSTAVAGQECSGAAPNVSTPAIRAVEVDNIQPDTTPPTITITTPIAGSLNNSSPIDVAASDPSGVRQIQLYIGGQLRSTVTDRNQMTYRWNANPWKGQTVSIRAQAWDKLGNGPGSREVLVQVPK